MPSAPLAIGFDFGGSKIAGGVVDGAGAIVERFATRPAEANTPAEVLRTVLDIVDEVRQRHNVDGIGFCVAGLVDWPAGASDGRTTRGMTAWNCAGWWRTPPG